MTARGYPISSCEIALGLVRNSGAGQRIVVSQSRSAALYWRDAYILLGFAFENVMFVYTAMLPRKDLEDPNV